MSTDSAVWPGAGLFEGKALGTRHHLPFQVCQALGLAKQNHSPLGRVTLPHGVVLLAFEWHSLRFFCRSNLM